MNKSKLILICEDDPGVSELERVILEENGYHVRILNNGRGILKKIKEYLPNLLLLDLWMPGIEGEEIIRILKSDPETKKLPVVVVSALDDAEERAKEQGADGFLSKPFDLEDLLGVVKKYCD